MAAAIANQRLHQVSQKKKIRTSSCFFLYYTKIKEGSPEILQSIFDRSITGMMRLAVIKE